MEDNPWRVMWREIYYDRIALIGLVLFIVIVGAIYISALFIDDGILMRVDAETIRNRNRPPVWTEMRVLGDARPTPGFILGTDGAGLCMLQKLILGARNSLNIAFSVAFIGTVIGMLVGLFSGFYGGHVDNVIMRIMDFLAMVPLIMIVILTVQLMSPISVFMLSVLLIALVAWQPTARLIRIMALKQSMLDYVSASKTMGTPSIVIIFREVLPNLVSITLSNFTLTLAAFVGIETGLSFLGLGLPFDVPSLGTILVAARVPFDMVNRMWQWLPAAILVIVLMLSINFVGQALNRAADAKKRRI